VNDTPKPGELNPEPGATQALSPIADPEAARAAELETELDRRSRRNILLSGATLVAAAVGYRLVDHNQTIGTLRRPLRAAHDFNALVSEHVVGETALAPTYPASRGRKNPSPNGPFGLRKDLDPASWRLQLTGLQHPHHHHGYIEDVSSWRYVYDPAFAAAAAKLDGDPAESASIMAGALTKLPNPNEMDDPAELSQPSESQSEHAEPIRLDTTPRRSRTPAPGLLLDIDYLKANFPFVEETTEFHCIEGWSEIITYGGIRFRDFLEAHPPFRNPNGSLPRYAAINTPDGGYYSGYEIAALLHPQTLLCFQMAGKELTPAHGAPLRLTMPLKYGYKHIKQIGRIHYTNTKPQDYWANLGYDWHGGL